MRSRSIKARAFGCLEDWEASDLGPGLVVIHGPNESGKSSLFSLVETLLFGFSPASADKNPYITWSGSKAEAFAVIEADDGAEAEVYRCLVRRVEGSLTRGSQTQRIENNPLPQLEFMPRKVFSEVYALTVDRLRLPEEEAWTRLQEQLLGGQYRGFLRPVSEVTDSLEEEASALWRKTKKGNARSKDLGRILKDLNDKLNGAEDNERKLHEIEQRIKDLADEREGLVRRKTELFQYINRCERLQPVAMRLRRIEDLARSAKDVERYDHIPADPNKALKELDDLIMSFEGQRRALVSGKERIESELKDRPRYSGVEANERSESHGASSTGGQYGVFAGLPDGLTVEVDLRTLSDAEREAQAKEAQLSDRGRELLQGGWRPELMDVVKSVDEAGLRGAVGAYKAAEEKAHLVAARVEGARARVKTIRPAPWLVPVAVLLMVIGVLGIALAGDSPLGFLGGLAALTGFVLAIVPWLMAGQDTSAHGLAQAEKALDEANLALSRAREEVARAVGGLPISSQRLERPDETLVADLAKLRDLGEKLDDIIQRGRTAAGCLRDAVRAIAGGLAELEDLRQKTEGERAALVRDLEGLSGASLPEKIDELLRTREFRERAESMRRALEDEHPDLSELVRQIQDAEARGETWVIDTDAVAKAKAELEKINRRINEVAEESGSLAKGLEHRQAQDRLDDIRGQIASVQEELEYAKRARDRLVLLRNVIAEADRQFREKHQPDVLKRAGECLAVITDGRYSRLLALEDGSPGLLVKGDYVDHPVEAGRDYLSTGTLGQVYLALRLALVDHLDAEGERLPLLLDEALVNWYRTRLDNGLGILRKAAEFRQVFLFTCHDWLAERLAADRADVKVVTLG